MRTLLQFLRFRRDTTHILRAFPPDEGVALQRPLTTLGTSVQAVFPALQGWEQAPPRIERLSTTPAAGQEAIIGPLPSEMFLVLSVRDQFTASAAVATRELGLQFVDAALAVCFRVQAAQAVTAGLTFDINYGVGLPYNGPTAAAQNVAPLPYPYWVLPGGQLRTLTTNIQAGDQHILTAIIARFPLPQESNV